MSSKRRYLDARRARVRQLYLLEGYEPLDIAEKLLADGTIEAKSFDSAARLVRADVAALKREISGDQEKLSRQEGGPDLDVLLRHRERLQYSYRQTKDLIEDDTLITTTVVTSDNTITSTRPKVSAGIRQKALKDLATIAAKLASVEAEIAQRQAADVGESGEADGGLTIIESDKSIEELIAMNNRVN